MGIRGQHKNKRDGNEAEILAELRGYGLSVYSMDAPADALVGYCGRSYLVEVKTPVGKLTEPQQKFLSVWRGDYTILRSIEDASAFAQTVRSGGEIIPVMPIAGQIS